MKEKIIKNIKELLPYIIILIVILLIRTFIATPIKVNGSSMYETLNGTEFMILNKLGHIDRYDIVVLDTDITISIFIFYFFIININRR